MIRTPRWPILCLLVGTFSLTAAAFGEAQTPAVDVSLATDGRTYEIKSPGLLALKAGYGVVIERDGGHVMLHSSAAKATAAVTVDLSEETPFGRSAIRQVSMPFEEHGAELLFRFGRIPGVPGATVEVGVRNTGATVLRLERAVPVAMDDSSGTRWKERSLLHTGMASSIHQALGKVQDNLSANREPMRIAGETFANGIGCHAPSELTIPLDGRFSRFQSLVGADDAGSASVTFEVHADGEKRFESGLMKRGEPGRMIDVDVTGVRELRLVTTDGGDGTYFDWANWAEASLRAVPVVDPGEDGNPGSLALTFEGSPADWLASPMVGQKSPAEPHTIDRAFEPVILEEAGGFYDRAGRGLFFGPVGRPVAYLSGSFGYAGQKRAMLEVKSVMDSVEVLPGETRWGQQAAILLDQPQAAQELWISWVAQSHGARPPRDSFSGWLSWYWLGPRVAEKELQPLLDLAARPGGRMRPAVIQIDDGYQASGALPGMNEKFPSGLEGMARRIHEVGATPGLMIQMDGSTPEGIQASLAAVRKSVAAGFRYLKVNRATPPPIANKTAFEAKRELFTAIREAAGDETYILSADDCVDRACVGKVDAKRVRSSSDRHEIRTRMGESVRSLALNRRWFTVDNDSYYLTAESPGLPPVAGGTPVVRTWLSMTGLACGNAMTSEPWHWKSMAPFLRNTEILTPPARETARAIDIGTSPGLPRIVGHVSRPWGDWTVALLWNTGTQAKEITLDFATAGMDPATRYAVWSFWENRFLGIAEKSWTTPALEPFASQHLCFTRLDEDPLKPTIIGSNLHIWCGAAEFEQVTSLHGAMEVRFSDAGAREGDLFLRCGSRPEIRTASGCKVAAIESTGGDIWRVSITDRQRGMAQRIEFGVYRPVTHQPWFWLLVSVVVASLGFAAWRYLENLRSQQEIVRLQQKNALEEERARIARDLHDELGANLARIGLLTELAGHEIGDPEKALQQLDCILDATRGLTRQLDSVVWAVDPANDTLESLARYLHGHAEDYLTIAGIRCCFEVAELPDVPLSSSLRHHLLMITKEALHNIVKHSQATTVTIRLMLAGSRLTLSVEDDGCGCSQPGDGRRRGNGLNNMSKRAQSAGGSIDIHPGPNELGTVVVFSIDLPNEPRISTTFSS